MEENISNGTEYYYDLNQSTIFNEFIYYNNMIHSIGFYLLLINVTVGIIGNSISIVIFTRSNFNQRTNTGFLFTILCFVNIIRILFQATFKNWHSYTEFLINLHFNIEYLIENVILEVLSWIHALISFDRFITVFYSTKGVRIMSRKVVLSLIMFGLFVLILCTQSPYFIRYTYSVTIYNITIIDNGILDNDVFVIYAYIKIFMEAYIPYLIMVIFDIMVIVRLRKSKINIGGRRNGNNGISRFTVNTILIDLIYLVFNIPYSFFYLFYLFNFFNGLDYFLNISFNAFIALLFQFLKFIYTCFLFFIFIVFNRNFRSEFISIVLKLKE